MGVLISCNKAYSSDLVESPAGGASDVQVMTLKSSDKRKLYGKVVRYMKRKKIALDFRYVKPSDIDDSTS